MNDPGGNEVFFNKITFADQLIVDEMLEIQKKSDREGTSQTGSYAKFISHLKSVLGNVR